MSTEEREKRASGGECGDERILSASAKSDDYRKGTVRWSEPKLDGRKLQYCKIEAIYAGTYFRGRGHDR